MQILHGSATTAEAVRRAIQHDQESLRTLSTRYGINPKTVSKCKKRGFVADLPTGPKQPKSTALSIEDEGSSLPFADTRYCSERLIGSIRRECVDHIIDSGSRCV
jgi:hypothetical protein